ncbi:FtsX-like permease family protein [Desulfopila aestuarii]|uniref:ABC-type antimicrobial peptide transport system, permease component n=1 Tax=Desulfopila aestuarii DSM 18488 TaxID=1121416 RepID=A0A1M7YIX7_9BACT|nr:FtsX-like permease family protein [Desulfopila aestuarii]SHO52478.1 ABC-type antimicrobial peptide transport system, permease component [Desulfopila aestuarii DSM 18488]
MNASSRLIALLLLTFFAVGQHSNVYAQHGTLFEDTIRELASYDSRATGSEGYEQAAEYIEEKFEQLGLEPASHYYTVPVRKVREASITINGATRQLRPFLYNAITPGTTNGVLQGPLYYVGSGSLTELKGVPIAGSIVVMEFDSGRNWQVLASLGAKALIYLDRGTSRSKYFFTEKHELSPLQFPCFWIDETESSTLFAIDKDKPGTLLAQNVALQAAVSWNEVLARNIYTTIPGNDDKLKEEVVILEAFFDSEEFVAGLAPGADAAVSVATLLEIAETLTKNPPKRSVLLVASSGHAQTLAGMREMIWSLNERSKELRDMRRDLQHDIKDIRENINILRNLSFPLTTDIKQDRAIAKVISKPLKFAIDTISRELIQLRMAGVTEEIKAKIAETSAARFALRRLSWAENYHNLPAEEVELLQKLIPEALTESEIQLAELERQFKALKSANSFRLAARNYNIAAVVSLHLSSHGDGVGGFHRGYLYNLKPTINRTGIYSTIADVMAEAAESSIERNRYKDTLRPTRMRSWESWFLDQPQLGGEISSLAGMLGISLATTSDSRALWGTPWDRVEEVDWENAQQQAQLVGDLVRGITEASALSTDNLPRDGFSTASARTNLLLQGELFADYPATGTTILAYQGLNRFYAKVDHRGTFTIRGIADKKNVLDKLIIEGYRFDETTGKVIWAIDKKETGKDNYRLKMLRKSMKTDLVMFNCHETTVFDLLEPRSFNYMTKLDLFDGRRDAPPQHYWYSRIDTRDSIITSVYMEPGALMKMTLSDTVLTRKMLLTNATPEDPMGTGYPVDDSPAIYHSAFHAANDAWTLLTPRINNLQSHGIFDEKIDNLQQRGLAALKKSNEGYRDLNYAEAREAAAESLALASRVYVQVEKTQKDVLFGVLFYIALFVPFAFCMERFLFNFTTIYKRIIGFAMILALLIAIIYQVHPAFQLTYSPMVVILAFFIIGLSLMVTLIIFFRFEEEMALLQRRATHKRPEEISRWKAFVAAFFLGVSNLRRRRLRTLLTCSTLIILTFTIMSFTTIKSSRQQNLLLFQDTAPYHGLLLKKLNWASLPTQATDILVNSMQALEHPAPRVWLEAVDPSQTIQAPIANGDNQAVLQGLIGLSPDEPYVTGLDSVLTSGRWFTKEDRQAILLEEKMAARLRVVGNNSEVQLWGEVYQVVGTFSAELLEKAVDLDGEPLTPVTFPEEAGSNISEEEQEAKESGEEIISFQSRYRHVAASQVAIVPASTLLAAGGTLKNIAVRPENSDTLKEIATLLTDRFSLVIFSGAPDGVWLYNVSDTINYQGVPDIIIPLLISILIVLNTMISSVYERKGEIGVYTSVGLAPSHVAFLFVAEALALAVISVVLGYVIAQVAASFFSATSLWEGITVNYSSMAGVAAMVLVILVVLISVIYPARVAARIAIPDVNQTFALPAPVNDTITVNLPFLMKYDEHESIGGFIHDYFTGHQDISQGIFSTGPVDIVFSCATVDEIAKMIQMSDSPHDLHCLHLRANVWLAPFDFGIMQSVDIQFCPAIEGKNYLSIKATLQRKSGESVVWQRINTIFLHDLRKQLLVWRSLDDTSHKQLGENFRALAAEKMYPEGV